MGNRRWGFHSGVLTCRGINLTKKYSSQDEHGLRIEFTKTSTSTTGSPRTLTLWCVLKATSGYASAGGNAMHANLYLGTGNTGVIGEAHAAASQLIIASEVRSVTGTWCAHKFVSEIGADNTMQALPAGVFFCRFQDAGTVKVPFLFGFSGLTAGTDNLYSTTPSDVQNGKVAATLRILIDSTSYWIPLWDVKDGT